VSHDHYKSVVSSCSYKASPRIRYFPLPLKLECFVINDDRKMIQHRNDVPLSGKAGGTDMTVFVKHETRVVSVVAVMWKWTVPE
jgi:hypothetical protein